MSTTKTVWKLSEAATHPLAEKYGITERQFRRAVQNKTISYARPGGLIVLLADEDITEFILGSRTNVVKP
ncbi:hypothetical protein SAMN06295885_0457 [Rathayibacter oskolensis]|uniref:Uncharacterized protein n=1 Tax=Rathayibacter oskolensis TaxID=1891671 RepID=A0A1X7N1I3_9MICO|nr:hypothetical protein [Rathayibacter oskolensis]SMH30666.1 hypothetical protein SAMN06295885_0457 [Rathayibacter oskolensis]